MTQRHKLKLEIPPVDRKDKANNLQLSFRATVLVDIPSRELLTPEEPWKNLVVEMAPSFRLSIKLQWKDEPFPDGFEGISEALGRKLANAEFWDQLSLKPSLSIPSVDEIVLHPKPTVPLPVPPPHFPASRLQRVDLVYSWKPRQKRKGEGLRVEELLPLANLALRWLFSNELGRDGVTGGVFLPGYAADISERQQRWDRIASSVLSLASRDGGGALRAQVEDLKTKHPHIDPRTLLKSDIQQITATHLRSKSRKTIQSFATDPSDPVIPAHDGVFRDLSAEDEANDAEEEFQDLTQEEEADDWFLEDADADDSCPSSLDREMLEDEYSQLDDGDDRLMLDDQHDRDILFEGDGESVHSMLEDEEDDHIPDDDEGPDSMLDDSDTQSILSDARSPEPRLLFQDDGAPEKHLLPGQVGDDMLSDDDMIEI